MADALANLASSMTLGEDEAANMPICQRWLLGAWNTSRLPKTPLCSEEEANQAMEEAHSGICGAHQSGPKLHFQLKRMGYYWLSMSSAGEAYILAVTDYFSKWAEAIPLKEVKKETFSNRLVDELCEKYKFKQHKSFMYHAPANGLA
ncbi:hypothetical protein ACFX2A_013913 [Malus domestica]